MLEKDKLVENVVDDLIYLREEWGEKIDDHSLRRGSPILRRFLVNNELQLAWNALGFDREPKIQCSTLEPTLEIIPKKKIIFASAGGAKYEGLEVRGAMSAKHAMTSSE